MRQVVWTDNKSGYKHISLMRDDDLNGEVGNGIPHDPPDLDQLDWDAMKRELHNKLIEHGLITWDDVQKSQSGVTSVVRAVVLRRIIELYKIREVDNG